MTWARVNGTTTLATYTYNPLSQRTNLAYNGSTGASVAYSWTTAGDLQTLTHNLQLTANDVSYTDLYTLAHQLQSETISKTAFQYGQAATGTVAYAAANNLNQYPNVAGTALTYDTRGNLTGDGTWTYGYDAENRLLTAKRDSRSFIPMLYSQLGRDVSLFCCKNSLFGLSREFVH